MKTLSLLLTVLFTSYAHADVSVGIGYTHFRQAPNGNWYQQEYSHDLNVNSPSFTINWENDKYRVGYIYTGKVTTNALAKASDNAYDKGTPWPLSQWYGTGKSEGIFADRKFNYGNLYLTAGAMLYRSTWDVLIPDYRASLNYPEDTIYGDPQVVNLHHKPSWMILPIAGIGYKLQKDVAVELRFIPTKTYGDEYPAFYRGYATNLTVLKHF